MKSIAKLVYISALATLGACTSIPPARQITLSDSQPSLAKTSVTPGIAVIRANLPDLIDRPQLVLRAEDNLVVLSDQYRWAEPLRREIPRLISNDLGELLDSSRVVALAADEAGFPVDFKLTLDFQKLDAVIGKGVDVDVLWRLEDRSGKSFVGRSAFRQPLVEPTTNQSALVVLHRQALRRVAADIASELRHISMSN